MKSQKLSRRDFLRGAGLTGLGLTLAAAGCQPKTVIVEKEVEKIVKETVVVEKEAPTPAPMEVVQIQHAHWGRPIQGEAWQQCLDFFMERFPYIEVERIHIPSNYPDKMMTAFAAGTGPDVLRISGQMVDVLALQGSLLALEPFIEQSGIDLDEWVPGVWEYGFWKGHQYLLPVFWVTSVVAYNKDLFDAEGLDYPTKEWTQHEFRDIAIALSKRTESGLPEQYGCQLNRGNQYLAVWAHQNGGETFDRDICPTEYHWDHPKTIEALQFLADLVNVDQAAPTIADEQAGLAGFTSGRIGMGICGPWDWLMYNAEADFEWGLVETPSNVGEFRPTSWTGQMAINAETEKTDAAWEFLHFCTTSETGQGVLCEKLVMCPVTRALQLKLWPRICQFINVPDGTVVTDLYDAPVMHFNPTGPTWAEVRNTYLNPAFEEILLGNRKASEVLPEIADQVNEILNREECPK
jgi:multiple sugar transport system substrate-binding protein